MSRWPTRPARRGAGQWRGGPSGAGWFGASAGSGSRQDGSSAESGRDKGGGSLAAVYPDEAEDQAAELPLIEGAELSPVRRTFFSPPSLRTRDGILVMSDDALMDATTNNGRVALVRIEQGHWGTPPEFIDILNGVPDDHVDAVVAEVRGNAKYGNQGEAPQAYDVLAYTNDLVRSGRQLHDFHTRLYAWALLFLVHRMGTFEVAANKFGRLRRALPEAVVLSRHTASQLSAGPEVDKVEPDISAHYTRNNAYSVPQPRIHIVLCPSTAGYTEPK